MGRPIRINIRDPQSAAGNQLRTRIRLTPPSYRRLGARSVSATAFHSRNLTGDCERNQSHHCKRKDDDNHGKLPSDHTKKKGRPASKLNLCLINNLHRECMKFCSQEWTSVRHNALSSSSSTRLQRSNSSPDRNGSPQETQPVMPYSAGLIHPPYAPSRTAPRHSSFREAASC